MSSIYKLSISGIRSFSDETQETIQFSKPLTLIVGTNGSGKTTIIECLRYATTNELPPNTKTGASFINDPNLHSSNETKAQIKLAFQNTKKVNMILSKSLAAIKNPRTKQISFKTKENQLMAIHNGEKQTLSSKVADIENLIPHHLGVSKAILNYVIFCHQDESLWPISESAVLKKKFDEIFDSSKFIKILDSIKIITKDINNDVKLINNNVEHLKNDKTRAINKRQSIKVLEKQIDENKKLMEKLQDQIDEVTQQLQQLYTSNQDYEKTISKMESLEQDKKNIIRNIESVKITTELINKPKEILLEDLNNFADVLANQMRNCSSIQNNIELKTRELQNIRNELNDLLMRNGTLEAIYLKNKENLNKREELISQFANQINVTDPSEFDSKLEIKLSQLLEEHKMKSKDYNSILGDISKDLSEIKFSHTKENQYLEYMNKDLLSLTHKNQELESRYIGITGNETKLNKFRQELAIKEEGFVKIKSLNEISKLNTRIESETKSLNLFEFELEENQHKMQINRKNNDIVSKIQVLEEMNKNSLREFDMVYQNIKLVMTNISDDDKIQLSEIYHDETKNIEKMVNRTKSEIETLKFRKSKLKINYDNTILNQNNMKSELVNLKNQFEKINSEYRSVYGDNLQLQNFESILSNVENDYNEEFEDFKDVQFLLAFNNRAIKSAEKKQMCYLCRRKFDDDNKQRDQLPKFIELLQNRNNELSQKVGIEKLLDKKELLLNGLRDFKQSSSRLINLQTTLLPAIEKSLLDDSKKMNEYDEELQSSENKMKEKILRLENMKSIQNDINTFVHQNSEISERSKQIFRLKETLSEQGLTFDTGELEKQNKELYSSLKNIRNSLESLRLDRDMKQKRNNELEADINKLKLSINELELQSLDKINVEKAIKEMKDQISDLKNNIQVSESKIEVLTVNLKKAELNYEQQETCKNDDLKIILQKIEELENIKHHFAKIDEEIKEFYENNISTKYENCKIAVTAKKNEIELNQNSIDVEQRELKRLESLVSDSTNQERNIRLNLNLLNFEDDLKLIEESIEKLDTKKAYAQRSEYLKQASNLQEVQKDYQRDFSTKLGETTQLEKQMKDIYSEIERDYKDIDKKYSSEYAKLQTKLAMATDLTTLYKATDNGVMQFHQTQMKKINNIIDELWKKTYTGNDVETIKIKADPIAAKKKTETIASNNRSYNYRVVMVKNGTELDMRGRCSAGQRVLASIIIRIALAECFCLNFGMIALDEPTTNLDDENIESLARALHAIIQERSIQRNFQLIIITHDEKFLRCMNAVDFTDHYYKIMRDERLNSTINRVSIATVTE